MITDLVAAMTVVKNVRKILKEREMKIDNKQFIHDLTQESEKLCEIVEELEKENRRLKRKLDDRPCYSKLHAELLRLFVDSEFINEFDVKNSINNNLDMKIAFHELIDNHFILEDDGCTGYTGLYGTSMYNSQFTSSGPITTYELNPDFKTKALKIIKEFSTQ